MPSPFIADGYSIAAEVRSETGVFDPFQIEYRPAVSLETARVVDPSLTVEKNDERKTKLLLDKLISWSLSHPETGQKVPITAESIARLTYIAKDRIFSIIAGLVEGSVKIEEQAKN